MTIIKLDDHRPHVTGSVRCHKCKHEWVAVAPEGTMNLECPSCGAVGNYIDFDLDGCDSDDNGT